MDGLSCVDCVFFVEATDSADEVRWGFCRRYPPIPVATVADDGSDTVSCVSAWVELPYSCGEFRPRMQ